METKLRILHLEDSPTDAEFVDRELKKGNIQFETLVVETKTAFQAALEEFAPHLIIADHTLPSFDSLEAIRILNHRGIHIPIILVTATVTDEFAVEVMKAGADDYILKDRLHRLPQAVLNAMEKSKGELEKKLAYEKMVYANRTYAFISHINQTIVHVKEENEVFKEVCRIAIEVGKFKAAWIGMIDTVDQKINLVEGWGILPKDLSQFKNVPYADYGPQYYVLQTDSYYICNNVQQDLELENWKLFAAENGFNAVMVLPIRKSGNIIGTFNLYAEEINFFNKEEITLLVGATNDISFALEIFEKENQRKVFEEKLSSVSKRLQIATLATNIGIWDWDVINNKLIWDKTMYSIFGMAEDKFTGAYEAWATSVHPDDIAKGNEDVQSALRGDTKFDSEFRIVWPDKSIRHIKGDAVVVRDTTGKPLRMIGTNLDITERKKAEEALQQSESNLQAIFENTSEGFILVDTNGIVQTFNSNAAQTILLNTELEIKIGSSIYDFIHPSRKGTYAESISKILAGETIQDDYCFERKNGETKWFSYTINLAYDKAGKIEGVCITSADITDRKEAEEKNRFKANLLNTIGQSAIATDLDGVVCYWNKAAENIYGWTSEEAIGKNITQLTTSHATREQEIKIMGDLKNDRTWSGEFRVQRKDGSSFPALVSNSPIYDENNISSGILCISSDISALKKLEALLDKTNRLAQIGSWEIDVAKGTVFWSDITKEICEEAPDFIPDLSSGIDFFTEGINNTIISQRVQQCIDQGISWDEELQITTFKGNQKWVRTIGEGEFADGKCVKVYGSFQDINARKIAELEALKVSEEKNSILESIGDGFFAVNKKWIVTYWNKEAENMLGVPKNTILNHYCPRNGLKFRGNFV